MCILEHGQIKMHIIYLDLTVTWFFPTFVDSLQFNHVLLFKKVTYSDN